MIPLCSFNVSNTDHFFCKNIKFADDFTDVILLKTFVVNDGMQAALRGIYNMWLNIIYG